MHLLKFSSVFLVSLPIISGCGGTSTEVNEAESLEGLWTYTECEIDSIASQRSSLSELVFRGNQVTSLTTFFYNNTNCSSLDTLTITLTGSYLTGSSAITLLNGEEALPIDFRYSTGGYSVSPSRADTLASQGTSLEEILLNQGIERADNLPATDFFTNPNFYTVYRQQGDTLAIGIDEAASNNSPDTRLTVLNETYRRQPVQPTESSPTTTLQGNAQVPGLSGFWWSGDIGFLNAVTWTNYLTFDDGRITSDTEGVMNRGRAQSERDNPDDWSSYRLLDDRLELVYTDGDTFEPTFSEKVTPAGSNQTYDGCWSDANITPVGNSLNGGPFGVITNASTYCFNSSGQYKTDRNSAFSTVGPAGGGGGGSESEDAGYYRIDGHVITLQSNSGEVIRNSFGWHIFQDELNLLIGQGNYTPDL